MSADDSCNSPVNEIAVISMSCQLVCVSEKYVVKLTLLNKMTTVADKLDGVKNSKVVCLEYSVK